MNCSVPLKKLSAEPLKGDLFFSDHLLGYRDEQKNYLQCGLQVVFPMYGLFLVLLEKFGYRLRIRFNLYDISSGNVIL